MIRIKSLLVSLGIFAIAGAASANAEPVIATVNIGLITERYYKVQEFYAEVKASEEQAKAEVEGMQKEGEGMVEEYKELMEQSKSEILTEEGRKEAQEAAVAAGQSIQAMETKMRQFLSQFQQSIQTREQNQMSIFIKEIKDVIDVVTEERGATLVFDVSGASRTGLPIVLSADPSYDISEEVITRINATEEESEATEE